MQLQTSKGKLASAPLNTTELNLCQKKRVNTGKEVKGKSAFKHAGHGFDLVRQLCKMSPLEKARCWVLRTLCTILAISCEPIIV